ncbi:acyl transferase/acyl hydrolase/lysophospholipase [Naematelia encephala]|uniref:Patatin-like phospholipase domain-containing protein n=1 Tax=Naematelia encephala TaxID=71784 RepID=A0A1Y2BJC9_9TREE|nr:acyl transferase/acyl hydrolase/lysophospholipase [Naematelia encephala]
MRNAKTYDEWVEAAKRMDEHLGFDYWKESDDDSYADTILIKRVYKTLRKFRAAKDTRGLMDALAVCVRTNFAGTEGPKMYSETFFGTKRIVEAHVAEVAASIDFVRTATDVSLEEKRAFFRAINKNYGSSALCLSGGASFGYYHFGVIKAFLEADLLPRVITGTSAGGLVAALLCTRTNDELKELLVPKLADKITACEDPIRVWFKRFIQTGARFSTLEWARKSMFFTRGSLTFKEAYQRTGRALNVSVVPSDRHSPTILLNHLTAPNCLIWSAILASAAVPGILNPVVLMAKDRDGQIKPHNLGGSRFKDGSLREDIPLGSLHTQFNCNFSIVSQTNPHIHLFFFAPRGSVGRPVAHRKGKGWRGGFILSALESYIKLDLSKHFKVIRDLDLMPQILQSDWSGVFLQRFSGDLTLTPRSTISDWFRLLSDPDRKQLERMLTVGRRVTWPALHMVSNRMKIERAILRGRTEVRTALQRDLTTNDPESPRPPIADSDANQVPIESDADAGFASRSRRNKGQRVQYLPDAESFNYNSNSPYRRRKPPQRNRRDFATASEPPQPPSPPEGMLPNRSYSGALGETFRHVRASSLSAFGVKLSPFRSVRPTNGHEPARRSQLSISRWFGNASESSSEEDDDGLAAQAESGSGPSGDDDTPDSSGEEGIEPIPGGEPVSAEQINAGAAAGERLRPSYAYSPPSQDH